MNQNMFLSHDRLSFLLNKKPRMDLLHSFGNVSIASHMNLGIGIFFYLLALRYQTVSCGNSGISHNWPVSCFHSCTEPQSSHVRAAPEITEQISRGLISGEVPSS